MENIKPALENWLQVVGAGPVRSGGGGTASPEPLQEEVSFNTLVQQHEAPHLSAVAATEQEPSPPIISLLGLRSPPTARKTNSGASGGGTGNLCNPLGLRR